MADPQRLNELRRRVEKDPAALAFAQLAEECRRAGHYPEAVRVARAGLDHHPDYLSARVTLGRALLATGELDQAAVELSSVLAVAPENLAALRGLAEVRERCGEAAAALELYEAALRLAPDDPEVSAAVAALRVPRRADTPANRETVHAPDASDGPAAPASAATVRDQVLRQLETWQAVLDRRRKGTP